jgi:hypothetical protein
MDNAGLRSHLLFRRLVSCYIKNHAARFPCEPLIRVGLHEIKFDGYRVIARKDGAQVRLRGFLARATPVLTPGGVSIAAITPEDP